MMHFNRTHTGERRLLRMSFEAGKSFDLPATPESGKGQSGDALKNPEFLFMLGTMAKERGNESKPGTTEAPADPFAVPDGTPDVRPQKAAPARDEAYDPAPAPAEAPKPANTQLPPREAPKPTNTQLPPREAPKPTNTQLPPREAPKPTNTQLPPREAPKPANTQLPPREAPKPAASKETKEKQDSDESLIDYVRELAADAKDAIKAKVIQFLENDGKVIGQEIEQLTASIDAQLRSLPAFGEKTIKELNALLAQMPRTDETLMDFAVESGLLSNAEMRNIAFRAGQSKATPEASAGVPASTAAPRAGAFMPRAFRGRERAPEVQPDQLLVEMEEAKRDMNRLNSERTAIMREYRAAIRSSRMSPLQRAQLYNRITSQIRSRRSSLGDPTERYWDARRQWEAATGMSYSRHLAAERGLALPPAPASREEARRITVTDSGTGKPLGIYDEWTGSYVGRMPREAALAQIYGSMPESAGSRSVRIAVDGSAYAPRVAPLNTGYSPDDIRTLRALRMRGSYGANELFRRSSESRMRLREMGIDPDARRLNATDVAFASYAGRGLAERGGYMNESGTYAYIDAPRSRPVVSRSYIESPRIVRADAPAYSVADRFEQIRRETYESSPLNRMFANMQQYESFQRFYQSWNLRTATSADFRYRFDAGKNLEIWKRQPDGTWTYARILADGRVEREGVTDKEEGKEAAAPVKGAPAPVEAPKPAAAAPVRREPVEAPKPAEKRVEPVVAPKPANTQLPPREAPKPTTNTPAPVEAPKPATGMPAPVEAPKPESAPPIPEPMQKNPLEDILDRARKLRNA